MLKRILIGLVLFASPAFAQSALTLGAPGTSAGSLTLSGGTSGSATIQVPAAAGTAFQLPGNNDSSG